MPDETPTPVVALTTSDTDTSPRNFMMVSTHASAQIEAIFNEKPTIDAAAAESLLKRCLGIFKRFQPVSFWPHDALHPRSE